MDTMLNKAVIEDKKDVPLTIRTLELNLLPFFFFCESCVKLSYDLLTFICRSHLIILSNML